MTKNVKLHEIRVDLFSSMSGAKVDLEQESRLLHFGEKANSKPFCYGTKIQVSQCKYNM